MLNFGEKNSCTVRMLVNYVRAAYYFYAMSRRAYWNREQLVRYQNDKVREIVKYAYENVPFYQEAFKKNQVKPSDIRTADDLSKIPILSKEDIKQNTSRIVSKQFETTHLKKVSTSGSTGEPLTIYLTGREEELRKAKHLRANVALGQKARDRWVVITGPQHFGETQGFQKWIGVYVPTSVSVFDDEATKVSTIQRLKPDILDGYSSSLFLLAKEVERMGVETIKPKFIIGGSELIEDYQRRLVEKVFDASFYDQYACVELERLAWQCKEKSGYHIDADSVVMEFVDENGDEVAPGEKGEVVCTSLFNYAMPLIRYSIGDVGVADEEECACGRTLPLMKIVEGRKDSLIVLPNGGVVTPHVLCLHMESLKFFSSIDHYRIIQKDANLIEIDLKMKGDFDEEAVEKELAAHFGKVLNVGTDELAFKVNFVDKIPLDKSGKLSTVVSELQRATARI
jgi:phenylacetate-CoA ligase